MLIRFLACLALSACCLLAPAQAEADRVLWKNSLDKPLKSGASVAMDSQVKAAGTASLRIKTPGPLIWCLGAVDGFGMENSLMVFQAKLKAKNLKGNAHLTMWAYFPGNKRYYSHGLNQAIKGNRDWTVTSTPFMFKKGQSPKKVTLHITVNGQGTVWVDDLKLIKKPLPK